MRRKKWSEEEEQTLISKYGEMARAGTLAKLKTREKKFEPIAGHVNAVHHFRDNVSFPWEWSWRDLSVKIQNMRNQYLGVKQKIRRSSSRAATSNGGCCSSKELGGVCGSGGGAGGGACSGGSNGGHGCGAGDGGGLLLLQDEYDWTEGIVHWSNFLRYKEVFGDVELDLNNESLGNNGAGSPSSTLINKCSFDGTSTHGKLGGGGGGGRGRGGRLSEFSSRVRHHGFNGSNSRVLGGGDGGNNHGCSMAGGGEGGGGTTLDGEDPTVGAAGGGSGLGLEYYADEEDGMMRGGEEEYQLGPRKKKWKRYRDPMSSVSDGGGPVLTEGKILAFLGAYITEQRERDTQREAREREKEREREEREFIREVAEREREQNRMERERIREEQERRREREREDREWERDLVNRDRWEEEKQKERAWEEKREEEKQEWRERMTALQLGHQATIAQMQSQMMQSQQNVISLLLGVFLHGSPVEETPVQRSSLALQILHNLQQQHAVGGGGSFQSGDRKGGIEDSTTQYVIDGEDHMTGTH